MEKNTEILLELWWEANHRGKYRPSGDFTWEEIGEAVEFILEIKKR